ncbi:uncharacterized protein LOC118212673 [Anguilla anguilla]|uniref:uncharacterized protein LOC118212673 n=1 Tax=Anguilla anguilla TaxID=7936 RepID=UPI0015AF0ADA|nr:uncharacterized protein LOC118212673 [Anguilla anguilla]XP_035246719.1 uncharacterized protein LOC118212673 [Anguilla anguilla]
MALSLSPAAVCQCFTLVSLCTSVADPNWIQISNSSDPNSRQLIYGVAFTLHAAQNLTDTAPLGGVNGWGMSLLYALAGVCYSGILLSSSSFLFDFLGGGRTHPRLVAALHVSAAVLCLGAIGVCGACFCVIVHNLRKGLIGRFWGGGVSGPGGAGLQPYPGESFYIAVLALLFSGVAAGLSLSGTSQPTPGGDYVPIGSGDSDSEPPPAREPGEELGEVFPE